jgi:hypothetical protein
MSIISKISTWHSEGWKIPIEIREQCPTNCADCPVFKSIDVYNEGRSGRVMRVRKFLFDSALGAYLYRSDPEGGQSATIPRLSQQAFAVFSGKSAIIDAECDGPTIEYSGKDMGPEYACEGVIHINSRAERMGLE